MAGWLNRATHGLPPLVILGTLVIGAIGGFAGYRAGLPLGMLMGSMLAVTFASGAGLKIRGHALAVPQKWRQFFIPVIGLAIGANFPADFVAQLLIWRPTIALLFVFVPLAHVIGYQIYRRIGGLSPQTAYFAGMPGGFIEAMEMGEQHGAEMRMLIMLQLLRLILCIVIIPIVFSILEGHAVGSASGLSLGGNARADLGLWDVLVLVAIGAAGWFIAKSLGFPAAVLSGPLLLSALVHALGLTDTAPPAWLVPVVQWMMGTTLGLRLAGFKRGQVWAAARLALLNVVTVLGLASLAAMVLTTPVNEPVSAIILALAPGGVTEMSLVALSLHVSTVFVTIHHLLRIVLAVLMARIGLRYVLPEGH